MAIFQVKSQPVPVEAKVDGGGGDNWTTGAISRAKVQPNHHHQQTDVQFFYRPDALAVAQRTECVLNVAEFSISDCRQVSCPLGAFTLLVRRQEGHLTCFTSPQRFFQ